MSIAVQRAGRIEAVRDATQGSATFLAGMVAVLLAVFHVRGEVSAPPVAAAWALFAFVTGVRFSCGKSVWPGVAGGVAALCALGLNSGQPQELPEEIVGKKSVVRGVVSDRTDRADSVLLELDDVECPMTGCVIPGKIRLSIHNGWNGNKARSDGIPPVQPGNRIEVTATLRRPGGSRVPGSFDYGTWLKNNGFSATGSAAGGEIHILEQTSREWWNRIRYQISQWVMGRLPPTTQGLAEGLLVGKRGLISPELNDALQVSGTYHLLAISGQQLAMVAGWSFLLIRWFLVLWTPLSRRWDVKRLAAVVSLVPMLVYSELAGWSEATQRAALSTGLVMLGVFLWRKTIGVNSLILSAIVLLFFWPRELFGAGFHLTFTAVAALIGFFSMYPMVGSLWRRFWLTMAMTLFINLATAPVVAYHFHRLTPYGVIGNAFAVPWVSFLSIPLGLGAMIFHWLPGGWGDRLLDAMSWSLEVYASWVTTVSSWPFAWQRTPGPALWGISCSVALFAASYVIPWKRSRRWLVGLGIVALFWPRWGPTPGRLHVACLDVGQAQAVVMRDPQNRWMIIDAGGAASPRFNVGESLVSSYLWHYDVRKLERIVISHPQSDHMSGVAALMRNFPVRELWLGSFPELEQTNQTYRDVIHLAEGKGVTIHRIDQEMQREDGVTFWAKFPIPSGRIKDNDHSLVVMVAMGRQHFLFPGDLEAKGERWFIAHDPFDEYSVVIAPHHGSKSSSTRDFIAKTQAQNIVFSSDAHGRNHLPHPDVLARWQQSGATVWRTDQQGTVVWETDGNALWFQPPDRGG
ncbi:MAG: DNA internalization-related competence protein ComEC/Rec2 [Magnetococcales bacterium]|nr:DNA internalization-related competence protein ComEC/Rec2 [Magnetococcales bacterium]